MHKEIDKLYNYILWYNPYEGIWYGITTETATEFFAGNRKAASYFESADENEVKELIYNS